MKILITGSNGLLGQHLVKLLVQEGRHEVIATARGHNRLKNTGSYAYVSLDITKEAEVDAVISHYRPDALIHSAAMTQVDDCELQQEKCWQANVNATAYLVEAAQKIGSFFLLLSTDFIFDGTSGPYTEEALPHPLSHYGHSKLAAEKIVREGQLPWAIARTVLVYGVAEDMSRTNIILWVKNNLEQGKRIKVVDDQWRTPTLVQDLAMGCKLIVEQKATGIFHISGQDLLTPYEMALKIADCFHLNRSLIEKADATTFTQPASRPPRTGFVIEKARKVLGYVPHSFEEGIRIVAAAIQPE